MKPVRLAAALTLLLLAAPQAWAQKAVQMDILQRLAVGGVDRMTTGDPSGETCGSDECPSEGQVFYVPSSPSGGGRTTMLFRFNGPEHMDSTTPVVPGYDREGNLGFPYRTALLPGLKQIAEGFNAATGDHALLSPFESLPGYAPNALPAFGYPRFLNQRESLLSLSAGGVQIASNRVYGGALWNWTWNGKQFLDHLAYESTRGSFSFFFRNGFADYLAESTDNCGNHAPIATASNTGATQTTSSVPLANPFEYSDQPCLHPVVWEGAVIGKRITLNFAGMGPVARYTTTLLLPNSVPANDFYHPQTFLTSDLNRYWTYDAESDDLEEIPIADMCEASAGFSPGYGGIIVSDQSTSFAMGIYGVHVSQGGSVSTFAIFRHVCDDGTYSRMDVIRSEPIAAGATSYNAYMMTGTVDQLRQYMATLYRTGVK